MRHEDVHALPCQPHACLCHTAKEAALNVLASAVPAPSCPQAGRAGAPAPAAPRASAPPICLIHGPFGSGKSTLLVAILHLLLRQRGKAGGPLAGGRILVSAHTNVAVDRVLLGALCPSFALGLRGGTLKSIDHVAAACSGCALLCPALPCL